MLKAEIDVLMQAGQHPHIVELIDIYETKDDLKLIMEVVCVCVCRS